MVSNNTSERAGFYSSRRIHRRGAHTRQLAVWPFLILKFTPGKVPVKWGRFTDPRGNQIGFYQYLSETEMNGKIRTILVNELTISVDFRESPVPAMRKMAKKCERHENSMQFPDIYFLYLSGELNRDES